MGIHRVDDIIIYTNSAFFDEICRGEHIEKEIAEWIVDHYEYNIILDILNKNYEGLSETDKKEIINIAVNSLSVGRSSREKKIENCLKNYLKTENEINVQGFVRFRLKEYRKELEEVMDKVIDEYIIEKEYFDFIELLREFVVYQVPFFDGLTIYVNGNSVEYRDEQGNDVKAIVEKNSYWDEDLSEDDKLLTALVTLAPKKVNLFFGTDYRNDDLKRTIKYIFGENAKFL